MEWIGVDLDGTLAYYDGWKGADHIGQPIPKMLERVRSWLSTGEDVRIMTARVSPEQGQEAITARAAIKMWLFTHLGRVLPITSEKDIHMKELWDDRVIQVIKNTGKRADGKD